MLVKRKTTYAICVNCGFKVEVRHHSQAACEKQRRVADLQGSGMTNAQVGRELGISRERVRQILLTGAPIMPNEGCNEEALIAKISKLPNGRFVLSTKPSLALSEAELREELKLGHPSTIVEDLIYRLRQIS